LQIPVGRVAIPFLARHLAGLAADADRGVGEERLAGLVVAPAGGGGRSLGRGQQGHRVSKSFIEGVLSGAAPASTGPWMLAGLKPSSAPPPTGSTAPPSTCACSSGRIPARRR